MVGGWQEGGLPEVPSSRTRAASRVRPLRNEPVRLRSSCADRGGEAAQRLPCGRRSCPAVPWALHWVPSPLLVPRGAVGVLSPLSQGWWVISIKMTSWQMDRASVHRSSREGSHGCHLTSWWPQQTWLRAQRCSAWGRAFRGHVEVQRLALGPQVAAGRLRWWESSAGCGIPPIVLRGTLFIHPRSFSAGHTWPRRRGQVF